MAGHVVDGIDTPPGCSLLVLELLVLAQEEVFLPLQLLQLICEVRLEVNEVIPIEVPFGSFLDRNINFVIGTFSNSKICELLLFSTSLCFISSSEIFVLRFSLSVS